MHRTKGVCCLRLSSGTAFVPLTVIWRIVGLSSPAVALYGLFRVSGHFDSGARQIYPCLQGNVPTCTLYPATGSNGKAVTGAVTGTPRR